MKREDKEQINPNQKLKPQKIENESEDLEELSKNQTQ